jgi:putative membrane protein
MGLANLVPGISGGTMLLSTGVYPEFIGAVAEITTFRFRPRSILLLGCVVAMAGTAILLFAGATKDLVVDHRWLMYSLFIGLTLGGVPIVWRLARPMSPGIVLGACLGLVVMVLMAMSQPSGGSGAGSSYLLLFFAGIAGASAMILPGVSGGYLLLLMGQYLPILGAVDDFKTGLLGKPIDWGLVVSSVKVGLPVGLGVVLGVVGVSNLLRYLLDRYRKATLGALLGLLLGAVIGLWPFQQATMPVAGQVIKGVAVTAENRDSFDREDWPTERFSPDGTQVATALALIVAGFFSTHLIGRIGRSSKAI